ncbi:MAG: fibronectin type III domain-containing protein, partial [Patescibacteria group bacterium]
TFATLSIHTPLASASPDANPTITQYSDTEAVITYNASTTATSKLCYSTAAGINMTTCVGETEITGSKLHSYYLSGLTAGTIYYVKMKLTDSEDGSDTYTTGEVSFTTLGTIYTESEVAAREAAARTAGANSVNTSGGGVIVIDKTDKTAPVISEIKVTDIKSDSVTVGWTTNEEGASFVEYGVDKNYGTATGLYDSVKNHQIILNNLTSETKYSFRVLSHDSSGNLAKSEDNTFTTISILEELTKKEEIPTEKTAEEKSSILDTIKKAIDIVTKFASQVSIGDLEPALNTQYDDLSKIIPSPLLSGEPKVITTATTAAISWRTDKEANSLVAISPEDYFKASAGDNYRQVVGNPDERVKEHLVTVADLEPNTTYNYQVRSKAVIGSISKSPNFIFRTTQKTMEIASYS